MYQSVMLFDRGLVVKLLLAFLGHSTLKFRWQINVLKTVSKGLKLLIILMKTKNIRRK